ncbi:MAG: hypothetical protein ACOCRN_03075, partial [Spirochaetia bacterium]
AGGGYRIARSGGYNDPPGIALRSRRAAIYQNFAEDSAITAASLDWALSSGDTRPPVVRAFSALATPTSRETGEEWTLDRRAAVSGPLWYVGLESVSDWGRGEVIVSSGQSAMPSLLVTAVADVSGSAGELRAGFSATTDNFAGADGQRSDYRFRLGLRLSRSRSDLLRPRLQAEYDHLAPAPMPAARIPREYGGAAGLQFGPKHLYVQPEWSGRVTESAEARSRVRQEAGVRVSVGGDTVRFSGGALRRIDDEEAGLVRAESELRVRIDGPACRPSVPEGGRRSYGRGASRTSGGDASGGACRVYTTVRLEREDAQEGRAFDYWDSSLEPAVSARIRAEVGGGALQGSLAIVFGEEGVPLSQLAGALAAPASRSAAELTLQYSGQLPTGFTAAPSRQ